MKSIGYVLADFPVFSETFVGDEMRAMARRGHEITPIVIRLNEGPAQVADRELAKTAMTLADASPLQTLRALLTPSGSVFAALSYLIGQKRLPKGSLLWNAMKIAAHARARGCGHLHAHFSGGAAAHAIVAARWIGASVSFVCHGHDVYAEPEDLPAKLVAVDQVIAVCNDMADDLRSMAPEAQIAMVPCGSDPDSFRPVADPAPLRRLLFVGRLVEQKGIGDLLEAMALAPAAHVDIVGDGPLGDALRARVVDLGLADRVNFLGARPREWIAKQAPRYLGFIAPFKTAPDGARDTGPLVVKEAMLMELPVVATRFMGLKETVTEETGWLCEVGDPVSLAEALQKLISLDPAKAREMGRRGRERIINQFSLDVSSRSLSQLFEAA